MHACYYWHLSKRPPRMKQRPKRFSHVISPHHCSITTSGNVFFRKHSQYFSYNQAHQAAEMQDHVAGTFRVRKNGFMPYGIPSPAMFIFKNSTHYYDSFVLAGVLAGILTELEISAAMTSCANKSTLMANLGWFHCTTQPTIISNDQSKQFVHSEPLTAHLFYAILHRPWTSSTTVILIL